MDKVKIGDNEYRLPIWCTTTKILSPFTETSPNMSERNFVTNEDIATALNELASLRADRDGLVKRVEELKDALEDMASQFAYKTVIKKKRFIATGGLSALELCFSVLGWQDPHSSNELLQGCEYPGCSEFASCGTPTNEGYKNCCGDHFREYQGDKYQRDTTPGGDE